MRYYIVTTTKFADECISHLTYGATQSNWLANINIGDILFISQFNYKSQNLWGPFQVCKTLYFDKRIIFPQQRFFYRVSFKPFKGIKIIDETDLYLKGIHAGNEDFYFRIINLIQQNKHLHCISLTNHEGEGILQTFEQTDSIYKISGETNLGNELSSIDSKFIWDKNKLDRKKSFSSESDFESYLLMSLKDPQSKVYLLLEKLLNKYEQNDLKDSEIYNQFILGNAYPADIVILNQHNINVLELKKESLAQNTLPQIEKEIRKHLVYSLFSKRIESEAVRRFNFCLILFKADSNKYFKELISEKFRFLCGIMMSPRENTISFWEYSIEENQLLLQEV
jgi:hypothetical protein